MNNQIYPGFFITLEGCEGSGKTTQGRKLAAHLQSLGCDMLWTREPGGPPIAERIRELLLDTHYAGVMDARTELLLYAAARAQHVAQWIRPALVQGQIVISDRFADATLAYQGYARTLPLEDIRQLHRIGANNLLPDLTFLFDVPPEVGLQRVRQRGRKADRLEAETVEFHRRVRASYLELASLEPQRIFMVDATSDMDAIQAEVRAKTIPLLRAKGLLS